MLDRRSQGHAQVTGECQPEYFDSELRKGVAASDVRLQRDVAQRSGHAVQWRRANGKRNVGQPGAVECEIAERDGATASVREADGRRQEALREVVQRQFASYDQIREQRGREDLTRFTELEPGGGVHSGTVGGSDSGGGAAERFAFDPAGRNTAEGAVVDAWDKSGADHRGVERRWRGLCAGRLGEQAEQDYCQLSDTMPGIPNRHAGTVRRLSAKRVKVTVYASEAGTAAQPASTSALLRRAGSGAYILSVMRRFSAVLGAMTILTATVAAQSTWPDTLAPRAYWRLSMQAKARDSVAVRMAQWQAWAAADDKATAPRLALSMLSRFDYRYADAFAWLDSAQRVASTALWRNAVARERIAALLTRGEFGGVDTLLAAATSDTVGLPASELAELRYTQLAFGRRSSGRVTLAGIDSVASVASATDSVMQARLSCMRAVADRPRMLEHANAAIALATAAGVNGMAANCQLVVASGFNSMGNMGAAIDWFMRSERTARAAHDDPTLAAALQWHGRTLVSLGYIRSAQFRLTNAIQVAQKIDDRNLEAWSLLGIAGAARQIGDAPTASLAHRRADVLFRATSDVVGIESNQLEQAQSLISIGDLVGAERVAQRARFVGDSLSLRWMVLRALYTQSDVAVRTNRLSDAAARLDEAEPIARSLGEAWLGQVNEYRGLLTLRAGENVTAIRLLSDVRKSYVAHQQLFRYHIDGALSLAYLMTGDSVSAERTLIDANRELDAVRDTMAEAGLRKVVMPTSVWGGTNGNVDMVLASFVQSPRWLPTVFAITERARSRALLNGMLGSESTTDSVASNDARKRVRATASELTAVQRALKPTTALLIYAGGAAAARTSLMIVTKTSARGITLAPLDSLDRDIVRWLALLESGETGAGAGRRVAQAVLGTALRGLPAGIKRLVIVPQGPLYRVPFQALPLRDGVLGDRAVVTISPSVSLALAYAAEPRSVPAQVLAFGAGDTEVLSFTPQSLDLNIERGARGNPLAPLLAAADEARAAAGWGRGSLALTGNDATEAALRREAHGSYTILHAAAHALTSDQTLGANWLILRPDADDDGYVSGGELAELSVGRAMVVLSGCRTTGDFGSRGDAIDGLVAPLLARGVRTVVASHWAVSDRWTKVLMERFYQNLARGETTSEAMNDAQTSLRREGVPARFWAAFSVIGDGALTFEPSTAGSGRR